MPTVTTWPALLSGRHISGLPLRAAVVALVVVSATARAEWAWQNPRPTGDFLYGVAWNGSRAVSVGGGGLILTSRDGISWTEQDSGGTEQLLAVTWAGDKFVAVGGCTSCPAPPPGAVFTSPDGLTWTRREPGPSGALFGVTWTGSQVVAVGESGTILTSPDGVTWKARTSGVKSHLEGVASGGGQLVIAGYGGTILTSPDGVTWAQRQSPVPEELRGVVATPGLLVIVGEKTTSPTRGVILTSPDGITWTEQASQEAAQPLRSVVRHRGLFVVVGESTTQFQGRGPAIILTSPDGVAWTQRESNTTFILSSVVSLGERLVAVGWSGGLVTSEDGLTWTSLQRGPLATFYALVDADDRIAVAGAGGAVATSTDGLRWIPRSTGTSSDLFGLAFTAMQLVAVGGNGTIVSSPDGVTWTPRDSGTTEQLNAITFTGSLLVAVGENGTVLTSADGGTWTPRPGPPGASLSGVTQVGGRLVAVGSNGPEGVILTSETGESWVDRTPAGVPPLFGVAAGSSGLVAVGGGTGPDGKSGAVLTSPDGLTWSASVWVSSVVLVGAAAAGADLFAVGSAGTVVASRNGGAWQQEPVAMDGTLMAIGAPRGQLLAAGQDGAILARVDGARWRGFLPAAAHAGGANASAWLTDVALVADGDGPVAATVAFRSGDGVLSGDLTLAGGEEVLLEDVLGLLGGSGAGPLEITASRPLRLSSRTYTRSRLGNGCPPGATYGEALPGVVPVSGLAEDQSAWLLGLAEDDAFRTNVSVANLGGTVAHAVVTLFDGEGRTLGQFDVTVGPGRLEQLNRPIFAATGRRNVSNAYARVAVTEGNGVVPFASVIDGRTNDPMAVTMLRRASAGTDVWLPVAVHAGGARGSVWRSDLVLLVPGDEAAAVEVLFHGPGGVASARVTVPGGQQAFLKDLVAAFTASGAGAVHLISDRPVLAGLRVYDQQPEGSACAPSGTSGEWSPAASSEDGLRAGESAILAGLREGDGFRTNVSVTNAGANDAHVEVDLHASDGALLGTLPVDLPPGAYTQLLRPFAGRYEAGAAYACVRVLGGEGILTFASVIDNRSNSATTQPALR